jgi:hypothetical protein
MENKIVNATIALKGEKLMSKITKITAREILNSRGSFGNLEKYLRGDKGVTQT